MTLVARAADGSASDLAPTLRAELARLNPDLVFDASVLADELRRYDRELAHASAGAAACGFMALLLACIGLYGMVATGVTERTREIGVRIALGADRGRVVRDFVSKGLTVGLIAVGVGLPLSWMMIFVVGAGVVGAHALAPEVGVGLVAVAVPMIGVTILSSWLPARRSTRVDPVLALRSE
jgi:putative ABC transport system permease protein